MKEDQGATATTLILPNDATFDEAPGPVMTVRSLPFSKIP